jgi:hypothetical protein
VVVRPPAADVVGAALRAEAAPRPPEAWQALAVRHAAVAQQHVAAARHVVAEERHAVAAARDVVPAEQLWGAPGARRAVGPSAAAWVCHPDRVRPAPRPAVHFARATTGSQIASL